MSDTGPFNHTEPLLTAEEAARELRVSRGWVYAHARGEARPVLPRVKLGGRVLFKLGDLQRVVDECREFIESRAATAGHPRHERTP